MLTPTSDSEALAWHWLMAIPRFGWQTVENPRGPHGDMQVTVKMHPGELHATSSAPYVVVLVSHPAQPEKRFRGSGNSLYEAAYRLHGEMWRAGIEMPFVGLPDTW